MKSGYHFTTGNELGLGLWVIGVVISGYLMKPQIVYSQTRTNVGYVFVAWRSFCLCVADWSVESSTSVLEQVVFTLLSSISCCEPALLAAASCFCCYSCHTYLQVWSPCCYAAMLPAAMLWSCESNPRAQKNLYRLQSLSKRDFSAIVSQVKSVWSATEEDHKSVVFSEG